jgi:arylsulfatase A-like enzyme
MTGLYPISHGVFTNGYLLEEGIPTLPEVLRDAGYDTGAFLANMCKGSHRGWDTFFCDYGADKEVVARALEWLEARQGDRPYFLWVHLLAAHGPYHKGVSRVRSTMDPTYSGRVRPNQKALDALMHDGYALDERDLFHLNALYDASIMEADRLVGALVQGTEESSGTAGLLTVFFSDHGEELAEHNDYLYHSCSVFESTLHVPLLFTAEGLIQGRRGFSNPVELIDVPLTILDLLGIPGLSDAQGKSLAIFLQPGAQSDVAGTAFSEYGQSRVRTVTTGRWKLIVNPDGIDAQCVPGAPDFRYTIPRVGLFDLEADPGEIHNRADENPDRVSAMGDLINNRFVGLIDRRRVQDVPENLRQQLRALGYIDK